MYGGPYRQLTGKCTGLADPVSGIRCNLEGIDDAFELKIADSDNEAVVE